MQTDWTTLLAVAVAGALGTAFFAGAEIGLTSLDPLRIRSGAAIRGRRALLRLLSRRRGLIITTIIANNLFLVGTSVILTGLAARRWGGASALPVTAILTLFIFVAGEMLPKAFFRRHVERLMSLVTWPLLAAHVLLRPVSALAVLVTAAVNAPVTRGKARRITRDELRRLLAESKDAETPGVDARMMARVFRLRTTSARQVMIPLERVVMLPDSASTEELLEAVRRGGPTRLPVYAGERRRVIGLVNVFDVLFDREPEARVSRYLRKVEVVDEARRIDDLLGALRRTRSGMAVVVDAAGGAAGIVTVEDLVEEIVGELADEHEPPPRPA